MDDAAVVQSSPLSAVRWLGVIEVAGASSSLAFEAAIADAVGRTGPLWAAYLEWAEKAAVDRILDITEAAIIAIGSDTAEENGPALWAKLLSTATATVDIARQALQQVRAANDAADDGKDSDDEDEEEDDDLDAAEAESEALLASAVSTTRALYRRRLALPLAGGDEVLSQYIAFEAAEATAEITASGCATTESAIEAAAAAFSSARVAVTVRAEHEAAVAKAWKDYQSALAAATTAANSVAAKVKSSNSDSNFDGVEMGHSPPRQAAEDAASSSAAAAADDAVQALASSQAALASAQAALVTAWTLYLNAEHSGKLAAATAAAARAAGKGKGKQPQQQQGKDAAAPTADPSFLVCLHERAVRECYWEAALWLRYGQLHEDRLKSPPAALRVYRRAVRTAPHEPQLWAGLLRCTERCFTEAIGKVRTAREVAAQVGQSASSSSLEDPGAAVVDSALADLTDPVAAFLETLHIANGSLGGYVSITPPSSGGPVSRLAFACLTCLRSLCTRCVSGPVFPSAWPYAQLLQGAAEAGRRIAALALAETGELRWGNESSSASDDDVIGPSMPPHLMAGSSSHAAAAAAEDDEMIGPAMPPQQQQKSSKPTPSAGSGAPASPISVLASLRALWRQALSQLARCYPDWSEPQAALLTYMAHAEAEVVAHAPCVQMMTSGSAAGSADEQVAIAHSHSDRAWDALLAFVGREGPALPATIKAFLSDSTTGPSAHSTAVCALIDPPALLSRLSEAVACARAQRRYGRCRQLYAAALQWLLNAKAAPEQVPADDGEVESEGTAPPRMPLDYLEVLASSWLSFEAAVGTLDDVNSAKAKCASAKSEGNRRKHVSLQNERKKQQQNRQKAQQQQAWQQKQQQQQQQWGQHQKGRQQQHQQKPTSAGVSAGVKRGREPEGEPQGSEGNNDDTSYVITGFQSKRHRGLGYSGNSSSMADAAESTALEEPIAASDSVAHETASAAQPVEASSAFVPSLQIQEEEAMEDATEREAAGPSQATHLSGLAAFLGQAKAVAEPLPPPAAKAKPSQQHQSARVAHGPTVASAPVSGASARGRGGGRGAAASASASGRGGRGGRRGWLDVSGEESHDHSGWSAKTDERHERSAVAAVTPTPSSSSSSSEPAASIVSSSSASQQAPIAPTPAAAVDVAESSSSSSSSSSSIASVAVAAPGSSAGANGGAAGSVAPNDSGGGIEPCAVSLHNLPFAKGVATSDSVAALFAPAGKVARVHLSTNHQGQCKGYGWVLFDTPHAAATALGMNKAVSLGGRPVIVSHCKKETIAREAAAVEGEAAKPDAAAAPVAVGPKTMFAPRALARKQLPAAVSIGSASNGSAAAVHMSGQKPA